MRSAPTGGAPLERRPIPEGSPVRFLVGAHAWVAGSIPCWGTQERQRTDVPLSHQRCCLPSPSLMRIRKPLKKKTRNHSAERSQGNKGCVWGGFFLRGKAKDHNSALQENKRTGLQPKDSGPSPPGSRRDTGPEREWAWLPPPSPLEPSA